MMSVRIGKILPFDQMILFSGEKKSNEIGTGEEPISQKVTIL